MGLYLKNAWYVAAFCDELSPTALFSRTILGERVVFFRDAEGTAAALFDRCPHRFAKLHQGSLSGGVLECAYHGLRFDRTGACVHNPHGDGAIPGRAAVKTYPLCERHGVVWIWMGAPDRADVALIPDFSAFDGAKPGALNKGYMHTPAHYELVTDNLMDLSHADYVHKVSLNTGGALSKLRPQVHSSDRSVEAYWVYETDRIQPFFASAVRNPQGRGVQSFTMRWHAPSNLFLKVTARDEGLPPEADNIHLTAHLLTPESETTTHYFVLGLRSWDLENAELTRLMTEGLMAAFTFEDKPMLEQVQDSMGTTDLWELEPLLLSCDVGPVQARRLLSQLIKSENKGTGR